MVQPKYSPQEALERIKLMMEYDMSKTLDENKETIKEPINEALPALLALPWLIGYGATALVGIGTWIYNTQGGGDSFTKTQTFFAGCSKNMKDLKPTVDKSEYRAAADSIYNAIEGIGTDTNAIKAALNSMPTVSDLCALNSWYSTQYGDLYDDLDSDIDGTDFTKYVWSAIAPKIADAEDDLQKVKTGGKTGGNTGGNKKPIKSSYKPCSGTYSYGCKSNVIGKVQGCLGLVPDGKFGKKTKAALASKGFTSFTDGDVTKICASKQPVKPQTDEFSVQADADDSLSLLNT
jgi:hypothetical protein